MSVALFHVLLAKIQSFPTSDASRDMAIDQLISPKFDAKESYGDERSLRLLRCAIRLGEEAAALLAALEECGKPKEEEPGKAAAVYRVLKDGWLEPVCGK